MNEVTWRRINMLLRVGLGELRSQPQHVDILGEGTLTEFKEACAALNKLRKASGY